MGRDRQFSEDEVLDAVADVFAAHGYQGTSLSMLLAATGLGKQSLYNVFGDKRELYLKALDRAACRFAAGRATMGAAATGREAVQGFFDLLLRQCASADAAQQSCAVCSGLLEDLPDDTIHRELLDRWRASRELLRDAVERGQKDGSILNPMPSATMADLLMALMGGLRVSARAATHSDRLADVARLGLSLLDRR